MFAFLEKCSMGYNCILWAMLLGTIVVALAFPVLNGMLVYPAYEAILLEGVEHDASLIARHVTPSLFRNQEVEGYTTLSIDKLAILEALESDFNLMKVRFINENGVTLYSTDSTEFGTWYDPERFQELLNRTRPQLVLSSLESVQLGGEDGSRDVVITLVPSYYDGRFVGALESYTDVTERKDHMDFVARTSTIAMSILALGLVVATTILFRRQTTHLQLLEATQELRSDVERIVQHDLRAPLTNMLSGINYLLNVAQDADQKEILEQIQTSGWRMMYMINRSLDIYKMESGTYEFVPEAVNILVVMREVAMELNDLALSRMVSVRLTHEGDSFDEYARHIIPAEQLLCHTLLVNLLKNALEASPRNGEVVVDARLGHEEHLLSVFNIGTIPEDIRATFFDKYVTHGKRSGTGLGTYSAKLITETQGGSIDLICGDKTVTVLIRFPAIPLWDQDNT